MCFLRAFLRTFSRNREIIIGKKEEKMRSIDFVKETILDLKPVILAYIYVYNHSVSGYKRIPENLQPYTADCENRDQSTK